MDDITDSLIKSKTWIIFFALLFFVGIVGSCHLDRQLMKKHSYLGFNENSRPHTVGIKSQQGKDSLIINPALHVSCFFISQVKSCSQNELALLCPQMEYSYDKFSPVLPQALHYNGILTCSDQIRFDLTPSFRLVSDLFFTCIYLGHFYWNAIIHQLYHLLLCVVRLIGHFLALTCYKTTWSQHKSPLTSDKPLPL